MALADDPPTDLSELTTDELIRRAKSVTATRRRQEQAAKSSAEEQGQLIAELSRRADWTFARIGDALGIDDSTAHRYAKPYLS